MTEPQVYTVSELQARVRDFLEREYGRVWVEGEISGFKRHHSGHLYFALRDADARLDAVMWRSTAARLRFEPEEGLAVRARGNLTVYPRQGRYQMIVQALEPVGAGPLQVRFEQMRRQLAEEGLFDAEHKKELPIFPRRVALITSPTGAAVRDLISVALRRWPPLELVVVPVKVQGEGAAEEIAAAIRLADGRGFDVLVVGRGGGSLEDLWAFNEEVVARAIFAAGTPVWTKTGQRAIETLQIGDLVLAQDVDTGELAYKPVVGRTVRPPTETLKLLLDGEEIQTTLGHPLWVAGVGWRMAKLLGDDAILHGVRGPVRVAAAKPAGEAEAFNLIVADFNTYFVGKSGILAHDNTPRQPTTATVPGLVARK